MFYVLIAASGLWVYLDATSHKIGKPPSGRGLFNMSAGGWAVACLLLWIIAFPAYLIKRKALIAKAAAEPVEVKSRNGKIVLLSLYLACFVGYAISSANSSSSSHGSSTFQSAAMSPRPTAPAVPTPADEDKFCQAVGQAAGAYGSMERGGANQLKLSKLRTERGAALRQASDGNVSAWVGTLQHLSTTGEGKAVLGIKLPCGAEVKTWNNAFSDITDGTLIPQTSALYEALSNLNKGDRVRFSGELFADRQNGYKESSLTEAGSMRDPEFIMKFASVEKL